MAIALIQHASSSVNQSSKVAAPTCPHCGQQKNVRRSRRRGFDYALSFFQFYPYRCQSCMQRFRKFGKPLAVTVGV